MQLDDSCIFKAIRFRAKALSSLHMMKEGMVRQKFQPGTPPLARLVLLSEVLGIAAFQTAFL